MSNAFRPRPLPRLRRLLALATDNRPVRGCLAVLASSAPIAFAFSGSVYATIPLLLPEPLSLLGAVLPVGPGSVEGSRPAAVLAAGVLGVWVFLCALVNAAAIGVLAHHLCTTRHTCPTARVPAHPAVTPARCGSPLKASRPRCSQLASAPPRLGEYPAPNLEWRRDGTTWHFDTTIPYGVRARLVLPGNEPARLAPGRQRCAVTVAEVPG